MAKAVLGALAPPNVAPAVAVEGEAAATAGAPTREALTVALLAGLEAELGKPLGVEAPPLLALRELAESLADRLLGRANDDRA